MTREAYVWRRQLSWDQMQKVESVDYLRRRFLCPELVDKCRFARCQLRDTPNLSNVWLTADGHWKGRPTEYEFVIRPLFTEYAIAIYQRVLADALAYYPTF